MVINMVTVTVTVTNTIQTSLVYIDAGAGADDKTQA